MASQFSIGDGFKLGVGFGGAAALAVGGIVLALAHGTKNAPLMPNKATSGDKPTPPPAPPPK